MRRAAIGLIGGFAVIIIAAVAMAGSLVVIQRIAAVSDARGTIQVRPPSEKAFVALGPAQRILAGTTVRTGADGSLTLNWVDGSRVRVAPNSTLEVLKCQVNKSQQTDTYLFRLDVGKIWVRVLKTLTQQSKFEIRTPTATAAVRGTVFSVSVTPDGQTTVSVLKGEVDVRGTEGKNPPDEAARMSIREGQMASVSSRQPGPVLDLSNQEQAEWQRAHAVALPSLELSAPSSDRLPAGAGSVTVAGTAERGAKLTVNGQPVRANLKGEFRSDVAIPGGIEDLKITVVATDRKGYSNSLVKTLRR